MCVWKTSVLVPRGYKSMLMNQKQGKRMADECMSPEQLQVAEAIKKNPPQSLLEAPKK